jgi:hypothetical protein
MKNKNLVFMQNIKYQRYRNVLNGNALIKQKNVFDLYNIKKSGN